MLSRTFRLSASACSALLLATLHAGAVWAQANFPKSPLRESVPCTPRRSEA